MGEIFISRDNPNVHNERIFHPFFRKYLGNKVKFIPHLLKIFRENNITFEKFSEPFMGTGVLSFYFALQGVKAYGNDILPLNYVINGSFMGSFGHIDTNKALEIISHFNSFKRKFKTPGVVTEKFGDVFIPFEISMEADYILEKLKNSTLPFSYKAYILTSLLMALEKCAYIKLDFTRPVKKENYECEFELKPLFTLPHWCSAKVFNMDAREFVKNVEADLTVIDPPFHEGDYKEYMHLPEFIVEYVFPQFKTPPKSVFCDRKKASISFQELLDNISSKYVLIFYSKDGIVSKKELIRIVESKFFIIDVFNVKRSPDIYWEKDKPKTDFFILGGMLS